MEHAMDFPEELLLPRQVIYRKGACRDLVSESLVFGSRGLIVHGTSLSRNGRDKGMTAALPEGAQVGFFCREGGEPALDEITAVIKKGHDLEAQWIAGIGGGSVLDVAKAAAGLFHARREPRFYQQGGRLEGKGIPFIAVPTTPGSGSEATMNAVIIDRQERKKLSIRDRSFLAQKVILDVELLADIPDDVVRFSSLDALVQAYESFISRNATWLSRTLALKAIALINEHIEPACRSRKEGNLSALLLASFLAGVAFSSSRLGVIHGVAHSLGVIYGKPHGLICAALFVPSIKLNRQAMGERYDQLSQALGKDFLARVEEILAALEVRSPFRGTPLLEKEKIVQEALESGSTAANPRTIVAADVEFLLQELFKRI